MVRNMHLYGKFSDIISDIKIYVKKGTRVHELMKLGSPAHETGFVGSRTYVLQKLLFLVVLMTLGITSVWGQTEGLYYIDNNTGHSGADNARYYIVPADDPQKSDKHDAFYSSNYSSQNGDREKPFLTVYKTNKDKAG